MRDSSGWKSTFYRTHTIGQIIIEGKDYDEEYIPYQNMKLYISKVDIKRGFDSVIESYLLKRKKMI